jgi:hypothetical protein
MEASIFILESPETVSLCRFGFRFAFFYYSGPLIFTTRLKQLTWWTVYRDSLFPATSAKCGVETRKGEMINKKDRENVRS